MLHHQFITKSHDLSGLFTDVNLMSTLMRRIQEQSQLDPLRYDVNDYMGDAFEFFVELFLKIYDTDNRVGVYNYIPIPSHEDKGADGVGVNIRKEKCVVQVKFRGNVDSLLTANEDHLSNLMLAGMHMGIGFDQENRKNFRHFVFTTAKTLHFYTDEHMFEGKVYCFGLDKFREMVDNNPIFWDKCREIVKQLDQKLTLINSF
jgi:hypothetical protein